MDKYMTLEEVSEYLKLSKVTMYRLVTAKKIPVSRVGKKYLFVRERIDEWVIKREVGALPPKGVRKVRGKRV